MKPHFISWKKGACPSPPKLTHGPNRNISKQHIFPETLNHASLGSCRVVSACQVCSVWGPVLTPTRAAVTAVHRIREWAGA